MAAPLRTSFDREYYARFYGDRRTRVGSRRSADRLAALVAAYLAHLEVPVRRVLDVGCGVGHWKPAIAKHFPRARYAGVEVSEHLCEEMGWDRGSVVDYDGAPADLVVCQGVLQYVPARDGKRALVNLARLAKRALYLEVVTREDWADVVDRDRSDDRIALRPASFYRRALAADFVSCGGGLFVRRGEAALFELERGR